MNKIDARGYSCPEPVIMTKRAVAEGLPLTVLVDNTTAVNNISRFAANNGMRAVVENAGEDFSVMISKV